ncbi:MAG: Gfo/Idh/MocA family oxidoreductase [Bacillota bacterium]|nr:Gfo/Idh/MocA family oxidoreductase [Bacillota bacterium]
MEAGNGEDDEGEERLEREEAAKAAGRPLRYAVVGLGGIARTHLAGLQAAPLVRPGVLPAVELAAAVVGAGHAAEAERLGFQQVQVVEEPRGPAEVARAVRALAGRVDFLDVCLPNGLHAAAAGAAWESGMAVYCEKPLTADLAEARALAERVRGGGGGAAPGRPFGLAYNLRFDPNLALLRALLAGGLLGEPLHFRLRMLHGGYLDPGRPISWKFEPALARGGALVDLGSHLLDLVGYLFAPLGEGGEVRRVRARLRTFAASRAGSLLGSGGHPIDDWAEVALTLAGGAEGTVEVSRVADGGEGTRVEVYGSGGSARIDLEAGRLDLRLHAGGLHLHGRAGELARRVETRLGEEEPFRWYRRVEALLPPPARSLGRMVDTHLASLAFWLEAAEEARHQRPWSGDAAGLEAGLAVEGLLEGIRQAAEDEG